MKKIIFIYAVMIHGSVFAQTGVPCNPGTFWAMGGGNVMEYFLSGNVITPTGLSYPSGNVFSLSYANNLAGTPFSPTFYSPSSIYLTYFDSLSWVIFDSLTYPFYNGGGHGNDLYFMDGSFGKIIHYGLNGFDTLYVPPAGSMLTIADVAVDQAGNVYCVEKAGSADSLVVISPSGIVTRMDISISDYTNAYGCFLLNGVFYIGFGSGSSFNPSSLLPITISNNLATAGTPIPFAGSGSYSDLEGCNPGLPLTGAVYLQSSDTSFCGKQCIDFTDLSTNSPTSWQWLFPGADSTSSNMQNPVGICYSTYGSFDVTLITCNAVGCDTLFLPGFINEYQNPPVPVVTYSADTLYSTAAWSYQWYYNSIPVPGATSQFYVFQQMGTYFVIVTDSNGCASSSLSMVLTTGIHEVNADQISVNPNPSDGNIQLSGVKPGSVIKVFDLTGKVVLEERMINQQQTLKLVVTDGIYFLEVFAGSEVFRKKILVNHSR